MTVRELIRKSMLLGGLIASGETMTDDEANDAFESLNDMIESWTSEGLLLFNSTRETFNLVSGTQAYEMGTGLTWNSSKPMSIEAVSVLAADGQEFPCEIINYQEWQRISLKNQSDSIPHRVYIEQNAANYKFYFWPKPNDSSVDAVIYSRKPLSAFTSLSQTVSLPQGYARGLRYNLTVELSVEYGKQVDQVVYETANELKANLKRNNFNPVVMINDTNRLDRERTYDIESDI